MSNKLKKQPQVVLNPIAKAQMDYIKKKATEEAIDTGLPLLFAIPTKVAGAYGWSDDDLEAFANDIASEYNSFANGSVSMESYKKYVFEHCGISFEMK